MTQYPTTHLIAAASLAFALALVIIVMPKGSEADATQEPVSLESVSAPEVAAADIQPAITPPSSIDPITAPMQATNSHWEQVTVKSGDSLAKIFKRTGLSATDLHNILTLGKDVSILKKILPGQEIAFQLTSSGQLRTVKYEKDAFDTLVINKSADGFTAHWESAAPEKIISFETASITADNPSLYHAGKHAGLSDNIIMKLSNIFQWDISFALDLRQGDSFSVMYEDIYIDGEKVKEGDILAATFSNTGRTHRAVRYVDIAGNASYFTPEGDSMRKAFLRDPVHFSHVSSSFNLRRLHPIHKRVMPHRGIDYAARKGTPVVASGDGKISIRRQNEASGKFVVIQHGEQYTTKYLHLSAFAKGIRPGKTVRQGQTIGYVGATGWATAPHLHYEFLVHGVHRNPKTVKLPKAEPIPTDELQRFKNTIAPVLAQLDAIDRHRYARKAPADRTTGG